MFPQRLRSSFCCANVMLSAWHAEKIEPSIMSPPPQAAYSHGWLLDDYAAAFIVQVTVLSAWQADMINPSIIPPPPPPRRTAIDGSLTTAQQRSLCRWLCSQLGMLR